VTAKDTFTDQQPKNGETILHCAHVLDAGEGHWHFNAGYPRFRRPDGSIGEAKWIVICPTCQKRLYVESKKAIDFVAGDVVWSGDAPIIHPKAVS
jgi:hypothetical protein